MRLWSLHPENLDVRGLVALWREALRAKHVLEGKTNGYRHHPQLTRFWESGRPLDCINQYLLAVYAEATKRGYRFDRKKIGRIGNPAALPVTRGQMRFETEHLLGKLRVRCREKFQDVKKRKRIRPHPIFVITGGDLEKWERATLQRVQVGRKRK
ncbi:MAG: DNA lyase [Bacteroidia bacterium]|nr:DNA lyase [Bacteroidia bacterium]